MLSRRTKKSALLRMLLAGAGSLALAITGAVSAAAEETPTATISGHVTREDGGAPVGSVTVFVNSTDFAHNGTDVTDANGDYSVAGLEPGQYTVRFSTEPTGTGLISEFWDGAMTSDTAQLITVTGGEMFSGIDASLQEGGVITGRVTRESDGSAVSWARVSAMPDSLVGGQGMAFTDPDGFYRITGLAPGNYVIGFDGPDASLSDEYWDGAHQQWAATRVTVAAGHESSGIDASLVASVNISGHVTTSPDGAAAVGSVWVQGDSGASTAPIGADGAYSLDVAPGTYTVQFVSYDPRAFSEYWQNARDEADATPVMVLAGQPLTLNAELERGTAISGSVLAGGVPLGDAIVEAWSEGQLVGMAYANGEGAYELVLPAGSYMVSARGETYNPIYATQFYDAADTISEATPVDLGSDADTTGIDFDLSRGGDIRGVVAAEGADLPDGGVAVTAYLWSNGSWRAAATVYTDGEYGFGNLDPAFPTEGGPLPAGTYTIGVEAEGFCTQFLGEVSEIGDAESVDLAAGDVLDGVDVTLTTDCPAPTPRISVAAGSVTAGGEIAVTGTNFTPGEVVAFELHSDPIALGSLIADGDGRLSGSLRIPATVPAGSHTLVALGAESAIEASIALQVTAATGTGTGSGSASTPPSRGAAATGLASTGAEFPGGILVAGLFLALCGGVLLRRRAAKG
ncbi:MSCRAMM family protein [Microbacterium hydrocarbonoxydans]|uniref:MSCRAMM family protein n=1 Tax=Microbacterium hydrocarbonoxydans TaxID=273678 RepID=UPI003D95CB38